MRDLSQEELNDAALYIIRTLKNCNMTVYRNLVSGEMTLLQAIKAAEFNFDNWDEEGETL